jgi:hypothetical protein
MGRIIILALSLIIFTLGALLLSSALVYAQAPSNLVFVTSPKYGDGWYLQGSGTFSGWRIYGSAATKPTVVGGGIMQKYLAVGAQASCLGYPLDAAWRGVHNSVDVAVGHIQHFQGGDIHWNPALIQFRVFCTGP